MFFGGVVLALAALACGAWAAVPNSRHSLAAFWGADVPLLSASFRDGTAIGAATVGTVDAEGEHSELVGLPSDWRTTLQPSGAETHLGDALKSVLDRELGNPLAGVVIFSDGRNNAGVDPRQTIAAAQNMRVPLYGVGLGSERSPRTW